MGRIISTKPFTSGLTIPSHWLSWTYKVQGLIRKLIISTTLLSVGIFSVIQGIIHYQNFIFVNKIKLLFVLFLYLGQILVYFNGNLSITVLDTLKAEENHLRKTAAGEMAQRLKESTCSFGGPRFSSQNPHGSSQPSSREPKKPFSSLCGH